MKNIYLLTRKGHIGYDEYDSMVVRAESPEKARQLANDQCGDEGHVWTNSEKVKCLVIKASGPSKVIINSFNAG